MGTRREHRRSKEKEAYWRDLMERQVASGQNAAAFCEGEGIRPDFFYSWRALLKKRDLEAADVSVAANKPLAQPRPKFVPVRVVEEKQADAPPPTVEVETPSGLKVRVELRHAPELIRLLEASR